MNARTEPTALPSPRLDDRFEQLAGKVFLTGNQAILRIALDQRRIDARLGKNTGGFISGYRGSPLGRLDMELWRIQPLLQAMNVRFQPGVNEDLAATAIWGTQYVGTFPGATVEGVFGIWYGKGPGVDRSGDPLKHGNLAGTSAAGGVLVLAGDDHSAKSSTTAHQSDFSLIAAGIPVLYPANVQDIIDFGLRGRLPDGSRALAGIGCHTIAMLNDPKKTHTVSHMGGEGMMWMGQAPFTNEPHVFANMGDGTYFHSGYLAIRQALAANLRMTYKLLFNGFVSMTGGQPVDGELSVDKAVAQLRAEGIRKLVVVTDDVTAYDQRRRAALDVPVYDRAALEAVQRELREYAGLSVLIYDQACATEARRLRKRGKLPDPPVRTYIDPEVCEGCGDCGDQSGCLAIEPLETALGRKRQINQSSCNKDMSCVRGFCPSFVTLDGAKPRRPEAKGGTPGELKIPVLPDPAIPGDFEPASILVAGIGGTGVVTIGAVLTMAAHLDGKAGSSLDITGLSQKYGAVGSHIRIAPSAELLHAARIGSGEADVLLGCDLIVAAGADALSRLRPGLARAFVNTEIVPTSDFTSQPDWSANETGLRQRLTAALGGRTEFIDVAALARQLLGDAILSNMLLLGYAWQKGAIPVRRPAMEKAIELNGVAAATNQKAFALGRWLAHDNAAVLRLLAPVQVVRMQMTAGGSLAGLIEDRARRLVGYQNTALADRYRKRIAAVQRTLAGRSDAEALVRQVATQYFRVLAVKDEFEVARLYARPEFLQSLRDAFEGEFKIGFHLAGGPFGKLDKLTGKVGKTRVGGWIRPMFRMLAGVRFLRGSWLDPFARGAEAVLNRRVRDAYEEDLDAIEQVAVQWPAERLRELLAWPASVRGYGHVRERQAQSGFARRDKARSNPFPDEEAS